jgi:hypothetical protein
MRCRAGARISPKIQGWTSSEGRPLLADSDPSRAAARVTTGARCVRDSVRRPILHGVQDAQVDGVQFWYRRRLLIGAGLSG